MAGGMPVNCKYVVMQIAVYDMKSHYKYVLEFVLFTIIGSALCILLPYEPSLFYIPAVPIYYQIAAALAGLVFGYLAISALSNAILSYGKFRPTIDEVQLTRVVKMLGYTIVFLAILAVFGVNLTGLLVSAGFLGIVIGLASQATLGNLFAGVSMMAAKPFAVGERVTFTTWQYGLMPPSYAHRVITPGYSGIIKNIGLMYTKLVLDDGRVLVVPNGVMNQAAVVNYSASDTINVEFRVELPISVDFFKFKGALQRGIARNKKLGISAKGNVKVNITDIGVSNYGIDVQINVAVKNEAHVKSELSELVFKLASGSIKNN